MATPSQGLTAVVPVLNEAHRLPAFLADLMSRPGIDEVVVVDGGSIDGSQRIAREAGVRVHTSPSGRGVQLHVGACASTTERLIFVHADARLPDRVAALIEQTLADPSVVAGAFRTRTVLDQGETPWFRTVLPLADVRSHYSRLPYGDQALFCLRSAYHDAGGFPDQPLMEDVELARQLLRVGRLIVRSEHVEVSARRWTAHPWRTIMVMNTFPMLYRLGVSPRRLACWYDAPR